MYVYRGLLEPSPDCITITENQYLEPIWFYNHISIPSTPTHLYIVTVEVLPRWDSNRCESGEIQFLHICCLNRNYLAVQSLRKQSVRHRCPS